MLCELFSSACKRVNSSTRKFDQFSLNGPRKERYGRFRDDLPNRCRGFWRILHLCHRNVHSCWWSYAQRLSAQIWAISCRRRHGRHDSCGVCLCCCNHLQDLLWRRQVANLSSSAKYAVQTRVTHTQEATFFFCCTLQNLLSSLPDLNLERHDDQREERYEQLGHDEKAKLALRGGFYKCLH